MLLPCSPTPVGPTHQALAMRRHGPRSVHDEGSHMDAFEAQSHGFGTGCLRFAARVTPTPRKTRFRLPAKLFRTGLITRRVPLKGFKVYLTSILLSQVQRSARTDPFFAGKTLFAHRRLAENMHLPPSQVWPGTGPFFAGKTLFAHRRLAENMDLSPSRSPAVLRFCGRPPGRRALKRCG